MRDGAKRDNPRWVDLVQNEINALACVYVPEKGETNHCHGPVIASLDVVEVCRVLKCGDGPVKRAQPPVYTILQ